MHITTPSEFARALRAGPYTSLGCYPVYFVCSDGEALSFEAAKENAALICQAIRDGSRCGWRVIDVDINYEDTALFCAHNGKQIESAYGEKEEASK
jgi:hypothetical protein